MAHDPWGFVTGASPMTHGKKITETCGLTSRRAPVLIFLSDGEGSVSDATVRSICREAINRGYALSTPYTTIGSNSHRKPLSFHTVSFGPHNEVLRRMAQVSREVEATAPRDPLLPPDAHVESSYSAALDSVRFSRSDHTLTLTRNRFDWLKRSWDWLIRCERQGDL
jgi:hypothetical protein